jgi:2-dehydro-3-deoxygluconokinase
MGETMVAFAPAHSQRLASGRSFNASIAGAESNVAIHLARLAHSVAWASRLGDDPFGQRVLRVLEHEGVSTELVETVPGARTGIMFKDPSPASTVVYYYRTDSAAAGIDAGFLASSALQGTLLLHTSGVTAALSKGCLAAVDAAFTDADAAETTISFDVNFRSRLWSAADAQGPLLALAQRSNICFVGLDEAEALWPVCTPDDVRSLLMSPRILVVKDGAVGATVFETDRETVFVPSLPVDVVEPVGAGDAFAAGFLSGWLRNLSSEDALQLGHDTAAQVLRSTSDVPDVERAMLS